MDRAAPGRSCPLHYRYRPSAFAGPATVKSDTLYVVGGLYGNPFALDTVLATAHQENATVVFNGDFNWFDIDTDGFRQINETVLRHTALRGNVETELLPVEPEVGCGCAYPDWVDEADVNRSNQIMDILRTTASKYPKLRNSLAILPAHLVAEVGGVRIGVVHGDAESLAGWKFSQESLRDDMSCARTLVASESVSVFASSHTCLPVLQSVPTPGGQVLIANNGASGMPNFEGTHYGIATRISLSRSKEALYGGRVGDAYVEAVAIRYNHDDWLAQFDRLWPVGSAASQSYRKRIADGPAYRLSDAMRLCSN